MKIINAQDCIVKEISHRISKEFLENNSDKGNARSTIKCGLYYNEELVQVMTLGKPRFDKNYQWEIIANCVKQGVEVNGGTKKLWEYFIDNNPCRSCVYYNDSKEPIEIYDECGFKELDNNQEADIIYSGVYNNKHYHINSNEFKNKELCDVLKLGEEFKGKSNEEILDSLGFKRESKDYNHQIYVYYPFGLVYRTDDLDDGTFYIGMCENKTNWDNGYLGSGTLFSRHLNSYPDKSKHPDKENAHSYKRTVLKSDFKTPKEVRDYEVTCIREFLYHDKDGSVKRKDKNCLNLSLRPQLSGYVVPDCQECGGKNGRHKKGCSRYKESEPCPECGCKVGHYKSCSKFDNFCSECGGARGHKKGCSKYKEPERCPECGGLKSHKITCSKAKICDECGNLLTAHKKWCSKRKEQKVCSECGGKNGKHLKVCSKYKPIICGECGGISNQHKPNCSKYKKREYSKCEECGNPIISHKRTCSKYNKIECEECGGIHGRHKKGCSKYRAKEPCPHCGSLSTHKEGCPYYKQKEPCSECGGLNGQHKKTCSKYSKPKNCCEYCGTPSGGRHKKNCPNYKDLGDCPECGYKLISNTHAKWCSQYKPKRTNKKKKE